MTMAASSGGPVPASRAWIATGFVLATIFSGVVTLLVGVYSADHQARRAERTAQVNQFIDSAKAFDPLVVRFVAESGKNNITPATRKEIKDNLVKQRGALEGAEGLLADDEQALAAQYVQALVAADEGLKKSTGKLDSGGFAQAAVHVAELRPKLYKALRD